MCLAGVSSQINGRDGTPLVDHIDMGRCTPCFPRWGKPISPGKFHILSNLSKQQVCIKGSGGWASEKMERMRYVPCFVGNESLHERGEAVYFRRGCKVA